MVGNALVEGSSLSVCVSAFCRRTTGVCVPWEVTEGAGWRGCRPIALINPMSLSNRQPDLLVLHQSVKMIIITRTQNTQNLEIFHATSEVRRLEGFLILTVPLRVSDCYCWQWIEDLSSDRCCFLPHYGNHWKHKTTLTVMHLKGKFYTLHCITNSSTIHS